MIHPFKLKIKGGPNGNFPEIFITSDTHYGHRNICSATTEWRNKEGEIPLNKVREFRSLEAMNVNILKGINDTVGEDDILFMAGDVAFQGAETTQGFLSQIVCKNKYLIYGNHDNNIANNVNNLQDNFIACYSYLYLEIGKQLFIIHHYPMVSHDSLNKGSFHLFGHVHLPPEKRIGPGKCMDIGYDGNPLKRPYHILNECVPLLINQPVKSWFNDDHHTQETFIAK